MKKQICLRLIISLIAFSFSAAQAKEPPEQHFKTAQAYQTSQKWDEALAKFEEVIKSEPGSALSNQARIEIGKYHKYNRDWEKAIEKYREVISRAPHTREAHDAATAEAAIHYFRQDFPTALAMFQEVLAETQDWDQIKYCSYWIKEILHKSAFDQTQQFSCGKESVKIALEILGVPLQEDELTAIFKDKESKLSLLELNNAASRKGIKGKVVKVAAADIQNLDTPFIASVKPEHYVVVTKTGEAKVTFIDPALKQQVKTQNLGEFSDDFKGYCLLFQKDTRLAKAEVGRPVPDAESKNIKGGVCWCCPPGKLGINANVEYDGSGACKVGMPAWMVNTQSLNFIVQDMDFSYASRGMPVTLVRTYNSDDPRDSVFGRSWTFNYNLTLTANSDASVDIRRGDGKIDHFFWNGTKYQGPAGVFDSLVKNTDGTYALTIKGTKTVYNFNSWEKRGHT